MAISKARKKMRQIKAGVITDPKVIAGVKAILDKANSIAKVEQTIRKLSVKIETTGD